MRLPTLKPSQSTSAVSPPLGCYHLHPQSRFLIIIQPEGGYSFYHPVEERRLELTWLVMLQRQFARPLTVPHLRTNHA